MLWKGELATHGPHKYVTGHGGYSQRAPVTLSPHLPLSPMLPASMSWQEVPRLRKRNHNVGFILAWPASAPPFPEMEARLTTLRICLSDLPCAERPELADGATGWAHCGPGVRSMPCYIGGGMCVLWATSEECRHPGVAQASRSCWAQPWSSSPTFLLTHLHQAGLSNLKEEGLVFLILLIINYLDWYCFAETEKNRNWRTRGRGKRREGT